MENTTGPLDPKNGPHRIENSSYGIAHSFQYISHEFVKPLVTDLVKYGQDGSNNPAYLRSGFREYVNL